jgi:hypothetical protein
MKKSNWYLALFLPLLIVACAKENLNENTAELTGPAPDRDPQCTPIQVKIDDVYDFTDIGYTGWVVPCLDETLTLDDWYLKEKGRFNVSASCNVNAKSAYESTIHATGETSGDEYTLTISSEFHVNYGFWDKENQKAFVDRIAEVWTITNESTGQVWGNITLDYRATYNANGEIVHLEPYEFHCP